MEKHLKLLSVLYIVYGSLHLLGGMVAWVFIRWSGLAHGFNSGEAPGRFLLSSGIVAVLVIFFVLVSAAGIIGAIGLLNRKRWARIVLLVLSFLNLIHFPFGTALGAYGIWVLMKDETDGLFQQSPASVPQQGDSSGR